MSYDQRSYKSNHPSPALCRFYGSAKGCRAGKACRFSHRDPNSVPLCRHGDNCHYGNLCWFRHNNNSKQDDESEDENDNESIEGEPINVAPPQYMQYELLITGFIRETQREHALISLFVSGIAQITRIYFRNFNMIIYNSKKSENHNKTEMFFKNIEIKGKDGDMIEFDLDLTAEQEKKMKKFDSPMCFVENIKIPSALQRFGSVEYDAVFKLYGTRRHHLDGSRPAPCVWLFDRSDLNSKILHKQTIKTHYHELPKLNTPDVGFCVYSRNYGLIEVGGGEMFSLEIMHEDSMNEWRKWMKRKINYFDCGVLIDGDDHKERLIGAAGGQQCTDLEVFNFENKKWSKLQNSKHPRYSAAICHNEITKNIYLGGGRYENELRSYAITFPLAVSKKLIF